MELTASDRKRFDSFVMPVPEAGCWLWAGAAHVKGYGYFSVHGKGRRAHRVSYEMACGPIPTGLSVCHKCDTPACVNPDHLFVGDQRANILDAVAKGRVCTSAASAARRPNQKLTDDEARQVLTGDEPQYVLARRFGVDKKVIRNIRRGKTYRWVTGVAA